MGMHVTHLIFKASNVTRCVDLAMSLSFKDAASRLFNTLPAKLKNCKDFNGFSQQMISYSVEMLH